MLSFLNKTVKAINRHGIICTYTKIAPGTYDIELDTVPVVTTDYSVKLYPKQIQANQYNYPNLIGKEVVQFYMANSSLLFEPDINDVITYSGSKYNVSSIKKDFAQGSIILYRITSVKA